MDETSDNRTLLVGMTAIEQLLASGTGKSSINIKRTGVEKNKLLRSILQSTVAETRLSIDSRPTLTFNTLKNDKMDLQILSPISVISEKYNAEMFQKIELESANREKIGDMRIGDGNFVTKEELIFCVTNPRRFSPDAFSLLIDTYQWYMSEKELFEMMLARIAHESPRLSLGNEPNDNITSLKPPLEDPKGAKQRSLVIMKVLIFMKEWFKRYKDLIITVEELQNLYREWIYLVYKTTEEETWILEQLKSILKELEIYSARSLFKALWNREQQIYTRIRLLKSFEINLKKPVKEIFTNFRQLFEVVKGNQVLLAKQLCMFDHENFKQVYPNELLDTNWSKREKHVLSPNIVYICEVFNRLSKLLSFYILCHPKKKRLSQRYEQVVYLAATLVKMNNYNSAYSVYLSLTNVWINNYVDIKKIKIGHKAAKELQAIREIFKVDRRQRNLKLIQARAVYPTIPFLGVYLQEILYICEREKTIGEKGGVNLRKFFGIHGIMEKILNIRNYEYKFKENKPLVYMIKTMPDNEILEKLVMKRYQSLV